MVDPNGETAVPEASPLPGADRPYFLAASEGPRSISVDFLVTTKARRIDTGGDFGLIEMAGAKGVASPPHSHAGETEAFFILEGLVRVWIGDLQRLMSVGDYAHIPKGTPHMFRIESARARFLCLITPGGFEQFFDDLGTPTAKYSAPDLEEEFYFPDEAKFAEVTGRYDWQYEGEWDPLARQ